MLAFCCTGRAHISQCSRNTKRLRLVRSWESEEDLKTKLTANQVHFARLRATETSAQREFRLRSHPFRMMVTRIRENREREAGLSTGPRLMYYLMSPRPLLLGKPGQSSRGFRQQMPGLRRDLKNGKHASLPITRLTHYRVSLTFIDSKSRLSS